MRFSERMLADWVNSVWDLRAKGVVVEDIAATLNCGVTTLRKHISAHGGVRPRTAVRSGSLSLEDRIEIQAMKRQGLGVREMAKELGRAASTVGLSSVLCKCQEFG